MHVRDDVKVKVIVEDFGEFVNVPATIRFINLQNAVNNLSDDRSTGLFRLPPS